MGEFALVVVAIGLFIVGFYLGRHRATVRLQAALGESARKAQAQAWQQGFDAASRVQTEVTGAKNLQTPVGESQPAVPPSAFDAAAVAQPTIAQPIAQQRVPIIAWAGQTQAPIAPAPAPPVPVDPRVRALRNINITLYVAALLLVAAASLFIALALPAAAKVVGLAIVAAGFYVVGLVMHARSERLRPAAAAFTATGLALIPMTGLAHFVLLSTTPGASWFVTSIIGTAAFVYAAGKLQSRVVAGLATTFLVSTAYSGGAVLNRGLIFYFFFSMLLATVITLVGFRKPRWVSNIYLQSFTVAHRYLVPATLGAGLCSAAVLRASDYGWLFAAACVYYVVALFAAPPAERFWHLAAARLSGMVALAAFLHAAEVPLTTVFRVLAVALMVQLVVLAQLSHSYMSKLRVHPARLSIESWILVGTAAISTVLGAEGLLTDWRITGGGGELDLNWALALLVVTGLVVGIKRGGYFRWIPVGAAILVLIEPSNGNLGRQAFIFVGALLATWWLSRSALPKETLLLGWAARVLFIAGVGAFFSLASSGWTLNPVRSAPLPLSSSGGSTNEQLSDVLVDVATLVGIGLALLVQVAYAVRQLLHHTRRTAENDDLDTSRLPVLGEATFFAGGLLGASLISWSLRVLLASDRSASVAALAGATPNFATLLWVGYQWDIILMWLLLVMGLVGATVVLGFRTSAQQANMSGVSATLVHLGGLTALAGALGISAGHSSSWLVEIVAALGLIYVGARATSATTRSIRVSYGILAQLLFSGTAWHIADRFDMDSHGQYALLAFTVASAQSARAIMSRRRHEAKSLGAGHLLTYAALAVLLLLPATYLSGIAGGLDQASLLIQNLCLLVFCTVVFTTTSQNTELHRYIAIPGALGLLGLVLTPTLGDSLRTGGWLPSPLWGEHVAGTLISVLLAGCIVAEFRGLGGRAQRWVRAAVALLYWVALMGVASRFDSEWEIVAGVLGAAGTGVFAITWGIPLLMLGAAALVGLAAHSGIQAIRSLAGQRGIEPLDTMLGLVLTVIILSIVAVVGGRFGSEPARFGELAKRTQGWSPAHSRVVFASALLALSITGLLGLTQDSSAYVFTGGTAVLVAVFSAAALEVPLRWRESAYEIAALVAAAVIHRCWWVAVDGTSIFTACTYWVVVLAVLAGYEFSRKREQRGTLVMGAAALLLSLTGVGTFLTSTLTQQLLLLMGFTALLVFGLLTNRKIFTIWGAVGIAVAVLWFLRGYTFLLLLLIAVGLIVLALWRLGKMNRSAVAPENEPILQQPQAAPIPMPWQVQSNRLPTPTEPGPSGNSGDASGPAPQPNVDPPLPQSPPATTTDPGSMPEDQR